MQSYGLRMLEMESVQDKTSVPAMEYALDAIEDEVEAELPTADCNEVSSAFGWVKKSLTEFLKSDYDEDFWAKVLEDHHLTGTTKKEAELIVNATALLIVAPYVKELLKCCVPRVHLLTRLQLKEVIKQLDDAQDTAREYVSVSLKEAEFSEFERWDWAPLQSLWNDLEKEEG